MWSTENSRFCGKYIEKQPKTSQNSLFSAVFWSKWRDSNSRPPVPETGALPTALHLDLVKNMRFSVSGQTCGGGNEIGNFRARDTAKITGAFKGLFLILLKRITATVSRTPCATTFA